MWAVAGRGPSEAAARRVASAAGRAAGGHAAVAPALPKAAKGAVAVPPPPAGAQHRGIRSTAASGDTDYWHNHSHNTPQTWHPRTSAGAGWNNNFIEPRAPDGGPLIVDSGATDASSRVMGVSSCLGAEQRARHQRLTLA